MPLVLLNKPYRVLSQFTDAEGRATLADFVDTSNVYAAGRLDADSEGLILLTDDGRLQARISQPSSKVVKTYWAQVEGAASEEQIVKLIAGVKLKDGPARALQAKLIDEPSGLWPRNPPIRQRESVADCWLEIRIDEGRNRSKYRTDIAGHACGPFSGPLVVSMRPMTPGQADRARAATEPLHHAHGEPVHIGHAADIGIADLSRPDFGDAVTIGPDEVPVFWACGVTPLEAIVRAKPQMAITHEPGHMFVTDLSDRSGSLVDPESYA